MLLDGEIPLEIIKLFNDVLFGVNDEVEVSCEGSSVLICS